MIVDLKPGLGEVALFLGVKPRYSVLDAIDNLHRLDREFLKELVVKHKSGLEILAGSDQFDRPGAADGGRRSRSCSGCSRGSTSTSSSTPAARSTRARSAALYAADIGCSWSPTRTCRRCATRSGCSSGCASSARAGERVRLLLNRAAEPYPIPPKQIEAALGHPIHHTFPSDYKTVSAALNSGVPLAMAGNSDIATQFDQFTRRILDPTDADATPQAAPKRSMLGLEKIASIW